MISLRSAARRQLLVYFFMNPRARHHVRELATTLGLDASNLSKELRRLEHEGLFRSETSGRQKYVELNRDYALLNEIRAIVMKTAGAVPSLAGALETVPGIEAAWLYGSFASGRQDSLSDVDVLIVGVPRAQALAESVRRVERKLGREVNYIVLTREELKRRREEKDPFLEEVWRHKRIALIGSREETDSAQR
jgi:predicted nucleotidyltransferase